MTSTYWLDALEANPEKRYVSAGNPGSVTVPAALADKVAPGLRGPARHLLTHPAGRADTGGR